MVVVVEKSADRASPARRLEEVVERGAPRAISRVWSSGGCGHLMGLKFCAPFAPSPLFKGPKVSPKQGVS